MAISKELNQQLTALSAIIADLTHQAEQPDEQLSYIDSWLNEMANLLSFSRLKTVEHIQSPEENSTSWQDGMLIINAATDIIKTQAIKTTYLIR